MNNIAVYWGSFNPPTLSHAEVIKVVLEKTKIEKIIFAPDWERQDKDFKIPFLHRKNMINIFFDVLKSNWLNIELDSYFLEWKNWNYTTTVQVNDYFYNKLWFYPWQIFWTDVINSMPNWTWNYDNIIEKKLKKIFLKRPGFEFDLKWFDNYILLDIPEMLEISSTMAREMIRNKQKTNNVLFPEIRDYIDNNLLYQK